VIQAAMICVCDVCGKDWLPEKTRTNPRRDPVKVRKCARCKSIKWNHGKPKKKKAA